MLPPGLQSLDGRNADEASGFFAMAQHPGRVLVETVADLIRIKDDRFTGNLQNICKVVQSFERGEQMEVY